MNRSIGPGAIAIVGVVGWLGLVWLGISLYSTTPPHAGFDLELLLQAGRDVAAGRSPYDPALIAGAAPVAESLFYSYPPLVAQAMALFAGVPSPVMLVGWDLAAVAGVAAIAAILGRRLAPNRPMARIVVPTVALAPLCFPFAIGLLFGNLDVFFPLLYGAMLLAVVVPGGGAGAAGTAGGGAALAVASLTKLHPASLAGWFGIRAVTGDAGARRVFLAAVLVGLAILALSLLVGGAQPWIDYAAVIRAGSNADLVDPRNAGPAAQVALLIGADDRFARTFQIGVTIAALAITAAAARPGGDPVERLARAAVASLVILPVTWYHYPSALIPFGLVAYLRADDRVARRRVTAFLAAALVVAAVAIAALPLLWLAIALVLGAVRASRRVHPADDKPASLHRGDGGRREPSGRP
ncbi:MAG TPA: glycosyltransferase 87 family protein [Candidatus Limnocylindrales bacterium]|nr:glycosyltransferase 87 family protein [Candidatus Limnocylindrales bacterium]